MYNLKKSLKKNRGPKKYKKSIYKSKNKSKISRKPIFRLCCRTNKFQKYLVYQNYVRC